MIKKSASKWLSLATTTILGQPPSVKAVIIGLLGVFIGGIITHFQTKKREIKARHFADKREGYLHIIDLLFDIIFSVKVGKELAQKSVTLPIIYSTLRNFLIPLSLFDRVVLGIVIDD